MINRRTVLGTGLVVLGVLNLIWGSWAVLAPRRFFDTFPGFGQRWTGAYPPYNEHLVTDLGATFCTLAVLLLAAAALRDRRVTTVVLAGVLVFSTLHLAFHATRHGLLYGWGLAGSITAVLLGVAVPAALLLLARR